MIDAIKCELELMLAYLLSHELNYNNADTSSGMTCYNDSELKKLIKKVVEEW
jgi:hypothetical protein